MRYQCARELFDGAREAALDVQRIGRRLQAMEEQAGATGGGIVAITSHGGGADRVGGMVARMAEARERLERREAEDYRLIDTACEVLYGADGISDGLYALVGWPADAVWLHYLGLRRWEDVGRMVGFSEKHVIAQVRAAFELADSLGMGATVEGMGTAEG